MNISDKLRAWLTEERLAVIDRNDFKHLYQQATSEIRSELTTMFTEELHINPLDYMDTVPADYAPRCRLEKITMPEHITRIGARAFANSSATSVTIPSSCKSIGDSAFMMSKLSGTVEIPEGVIDIGSDAFECCDYIVKLVLPSTLRSIRPSRCVSYSLREDPLIVEYNGKVDAFKKLQFDRAFQYRFTAHCTDGVVDSEQIDTTMTTEEYLIAQLNRQVARATGIPTSVFASSSGANDYYSTVSLKQYEYEIQKPKIDWDDASWSKGWTLDPLFGVSKYGD